MPGPHRRHSSAIWTISMLVLLPVLYVASFPVVLYLASRFLGPNQPPDWVERLFWWVYTPPLWAADRWKPLGTFLAWWLSAWDLNG